jgi:hypothetical protein
LSCEPAQAAFRHHLHEIPEAELKRKYHLTHKTMISPSKHVGTRERPPQIDRGAENMIVVAVDRPDTVIIQNFRQLMVGSPNSLSHGRGSRFHFRWSSAQFPEIAALSALVEIGRMPLECYRLTRERKV